jgi:hypothetical protein
MRTHTFQTPYVQPLPATGGEVEGQGVHLRVTRADADRILRAISTAMADLAYAPGGSQLASAYRRLAADVRLQTDGAVRPADGRALNAES